MISLRDAGTPTPAPSPAWRRRSEPERLALVMNALRAGPRALDDELAVAAAKQDGQVIVRLLQPITAGRRGTLLLDLEAMLKEAVDPGLAVWLEPVGDRNSLRNLRGIEVKA